MHARILWQTFLYEICSNKKKNNNFAALQHKQPYNQSRQTAKKKNRHPIHIPAKKCYTNLQFWVNFDIKVNTVWEMVLLSKSKTCYLMKFSILQTEKLYVLVYPHLLSYFQIANVQIVTSHKFHKPKDFRQVKYWD